MSFWKNNYIDGKFSPSDVKTMKEEFAKLFVKQGRNKDSFVLDPKLDLIFKFDISAKLYAINNWFFENDVKELIELYKEEKVDEILPTNKQIAYEMLNLIKMTGDVELKLKIYKEYVSLFGENDNTDSFENVVLFEDNGSNLSWEDKLSSVSSKLEDDLNHYVETELKH